MPPSFLSPSRLRDGAILLAWLGVGALRLAAQQTDIAVSHFEGNTYGDWTATGSAFGNGPSHDPLPGDSAGNGYASSSHGGDAATGKLVSKPFKITRKFITFRIGGGGWAAQTCMNLMVDGRFAHTVTGPNVTAAGTEQLQPEAWDVSHWLNRDATIEIVDDRTDGPWGHINVGSIVQTDDHGTTPLAAPVGPEQHNVSRDVLIEHKLLNFPMTVAAGSNDPVPVITVTIDGVVQRRFLADLAHGTAAWWAPLDVSPWIGKTVKITSNILPPGSRALDSLKQSDAMLDADNLYNEELRPQLHFTTQRGWVNDSNGLVYYNGEYHLFCQHNQFGLEMGNASWAHATSTDLVHWKQQPEAIYPDDKEWLQASGSAAVDFNNTSGFGQPGKPPLVLIYATIGPKAEERLAYSTDGRTFTKYAGNPVIQQITPSTRDPKIFWYAPGKHWVLVLYVGTPDPSGEKDERGHPKLINRVQFFTSPDMKTWTFTSQSPPGLFECPDMFEIAVQGEPATKKWLLSGGNADYFIGSFDGKTFTPESPKLTGRAPAAGYYAAQTFNDVPEGRIIRMAWGLEMSPGMPFNALQTLPVEVTLRRTPDGLRQFMLPVKELASLRDGPNQADHLADFKSELVELRAEFEPGTADQVEFHVRGFRLIYDTKKQELIVNGARVPSPLKDGRANLIAYVDRTVTEIFTGDGISYVPMPFIPKKDDLSVTVNAHGAKIDSLEVYKLKSIWGPDSR